MDDPKKNQEDKLLLDHEYDGIKELDNPLPRWWLAGFYLAIIFAIFYMNYYFLGNGRTLKEEFDRAKAENNLKILASRPKEGPIDEKKLEALLADTKQVAQGKAVFEKNCSPCHGAQGQGIIGPNLTDEYWIHGKGKLSDILKVVSEGVKEKGMPTWGAILKPDELNQVVVYVKSLKGSNPANPKAPQGEKVEE
ncbi:MAG: c-type cytochrome [Deltaproteobacteria bacterium]|nr:c-type cytochrome [Deltaproteobacteria bacterium]